ncbi:MAG: hypothetical protein EPO19_11310 [Betaproteobacteria bacterium]|nr:MAG: hypothetical protein EPO19_11310 [Betaproteobacteria bacterium]
MTLTVNGTAADRATIERWLQEICWRIRVNPTTGAVAQVAGPPAVGAHETGCACLDAIIRSERTVTVQPLAGPNTPVPGTTTKIKDWGGGVTSIPAGSTGTPANPGKGADGNTGASTTTHIDISNNGGAGYPHGFPMWFVLAHELTTGHASHCVAGTSAATYAGRERQAIGSEHAHADEHGLPKRPLPPDSGGFEQPHEGIGPGPYQPFTPIG